MCNTLCIVFNMIHTDLLKSDLNEDFQKAINFLKKGELVAIPTETVYGLAADARNPEAVRKIYIAKNRPENHPLILHIDSAKKLIEWSINIPKEVEILAQNFWPGPLTLLLKKHPHVSDVITGGRDTIAVRIPNNQLVIRIMRSLNTGLVAPSANIHTKLSPTSAQHVMNMMKGRIAAVLDDGQCKVGIESTILDLTKNTPTILRKGPISQIMIENVIGRPINTPEAHSEAVSGNMLKHYQPHTKTIIMDTKQIYDYLSVLASQNDTRNSGFMYYSDLDKLIGHPNAIKLTSDKPAYAKMMYDTLHRLDALNIEQIIIETPPNSTEWEDINDRLKKASYNLK